MNPPPNPHADEALRDMKEYVKPLLQNPQQDAASLIAACLSRWPDLRRYADTARVERLWRWQGGAWCWCWGVTVTIVEKEQS